MTHGIAAHAAALRFAKQHDWGRHAHLDNGLLRGIKDVYMVNGHLGFRFITLPASIKALREFGGY